MERWAEALLLTSLTKGTVQVGMLSSLNITFSVGLQLLPFPFAVVGWLARRGDFVTRLKDNAEYAVVERRLVPEGSAVRRDEIIFLYKVARSGKYDLFLRRIEVWDEEQKRVLVFLTNQDLRRHQPQRPTDSDLDGANCPATAQVPATARPLRMESVESRRTVASTIVRLSRPFRVDRSPLRTAHAARSRCRATCALVVNATWSTNANLNLEIASEAHKRLDFPCLYAPNPTPFGQQ
jgi:hypothetical protein